MTTEKAAEKKLPGWKRIYGFWALMPALCINTWGGYAMFYTSFGPFQTRFLSVFGISRAVATGALSMGNLSTIVGPFLGTFMDRVGYRKACLYAVMVMMIGSLFIAFSAPPHFWMIYVAYILMNAPGLNIPTYGGASKTINFWFLKWRGLMTGIMTAITGFVYFSAAFQGYFMTQWGIAGGAWYVFGIGILMLLGTFFVIRDRPSAMGVGLDGIGVAAKAATDGGQKEATKPAAKAKKVKVTAQLTYAQAIRNPALWLFYISYAFLVTLANQYIVANYVPFLQGFGMSVVEAGAIWGMMGVIGIAFRFVYGPILDFLGRGSERWMFAFGELMLIIGVFGLLQVKTAADFFWVWWWTVWWGLGWGGCMTAMLVMVGSYWGPAAYGFTWGLRATFWAIGGFIGPIMGGVIYDMTKSYALGYWINIAILIVAVILMLFAAPPKIGADGKAIPKVKPA